MKRIFVAIMALGALVSCSKDELVSVNRQAIQFGNAFVENSTRATTDPSLTATTLTNFKVWGAITDNSGYLPVFAGETVSGTVGSNAWNCTKTQYWVEDAKYNFAGLVNAGTVTLGDDKLPATVAFELGEGNVDLLYARSATDIVGKASSNGLVAMNFNHLLSKVKFTVNNTRTATSDYSFEVNNIKVNGPTAGTCALPGKTWTPTTTGDFEKFTAISLAGDKTSAESASELLLIPGSVNITFTVDIKYGEEIIATHTYTTKAAQTINVGHAYNFVINVSVGDPIQFSVTSVPTWENGNTTDSDDDDTEKDHIVLPIKAVTTGA